VHARLRRVLGRAHGRVWSIFRSPDHCWTRTDQCAHHRLLLGRLNLLVNRSHAAFCSRANIQSSDFGEKAQLVVSGGVAARATARFGHSRPHCGPSRSTHTRCIFSPSAPVRLFIRKDWGWLLTLLYWAALGKHGHDASARHIQKQFTSFLPAKDPAGYTSFAHNHDEFTLV
jgi:hypothetical protein